MKKIYNDLIKVRNPETRKFESLPGIRGESAYEIAVRLGTFSGTEEEYNAQNSVDTLGYYKRYSVTGKSVWTGTESVPASTVIWFRPVSVNLEASQTLLLRGLYSNNPEDGFDFICLAEVGEALRPITTREYDHLEVYTAGLVETDFSFDILVGEKYGIVSDIYKVRQDLSNQGGSSNGASPTYRSDFGLAWVGHTNNLMLERFNGDIELAAQCYAKHDILIMQILNLNTYADSRPEMAGNSAQIITRAKKLNPRLRVFQYIQSESERYDFTYNSENAYLNADGSWEGSTADLSGCTKIYNKQQIIDWLDYFAEIGADGVFWDDWGYDSLLPICYQMGYDTTMYSTKNEALNQKWIDLIQLCHDRNLAVITNGGFQTEVGNWYESLYENDIICLESCLISSYNDGSWNNGQIQVYNIYENYIKTGLLHAKTWVLDYYPTGISKEFLEKIQTYSVSMALACGGNYVSVGTFSFIEKPWFLESMTRGGGYEITKVSDYIYVISNGDHSLEVHKSNVISGAVTEANLGKCFCIYDGHIFQNAYVEAPYLDADISARLGSIESAVGGMNSDTRKNAQSFWRLAIDDWEADLNFLDYKNYIRQKGTISTAGGVGGGTINASFVENEIGGIDLVYEFVDCDQTRNPSLTVFGSTDEEDLGLTGNTLEFGFSNVEINLTGYTGYNGNTDLSTKTENLYDGEAYQWNNPGFCVYVDYTNKDSVYNPPSNAKSAIGLKNGFAIQQTAIGSGSFTMYCWVASTTTYSGTITFKNIYCVDANEHDDEIVKKWYTNLYPLSRNVFSAYDYSLESAEIDGHDVFDIVVTSSDAWGWSVYKFDGEDVIGMRGHTYEFGCMSMVLSNGETGRPLPNGTSLAFGVGIDSTESNMPNPRTYRIYGDTKELSSAWGTEIPCVMFTVPDTATELCIGVQSYGFESGVSMTAKGVYLYDLGEDVAIRGQASTKSSLRVCRVTEEQESVSPAKVPNALFVSDSGKMWCTKLDGSRVDIVHGTVELTQAEYDALPDTKLSNNVTYYITDGEDVSSFVLGGAS